MGFSVHGILLSRILKWESFPPPAKCLWDCSKREFTCLDEFHRTFYYKWKGNYFFFQKKASKINCLQEFTVRIFLKFHKYFVLFQISWENDDRMLKSWILNKNNAPTQNLFQWVSFLYQVAKVLELQLQHQSFQWIFKTDFPHAGKDWWQREKRMTEDKTIGWHHRVDGHVFE